MGKIKEAWDASPMRLFIYNLGGIKNGSKSSNQRTGRIGRLAFRQMFGAEGYEVVAINDLTSPKMLAQFIGV